MGRGPGASTVREAGLNKGPWTDEEDATLAAFIKVNGEGNWRTLPKKAGNDRATCICR
jgi:myb proto-oncogene protein